MTSGVYAIVHKDSGKKYIGGSKNIRLRFTNHRVMLRKGCHPNTPLQQDWSAYGENAFSFEILEEVSSGNLRSRESFYIRNESINTLYNLVLDPEREKKIGVNGRKISEGLKAKWQDPEFKKKMSESNKRAWRSERGKKRRQIASANLTEVNQSESFRKRMSELRKGKVPTHLVGRTVSEETRRKLSESKKGHKMSEEGKKLRSELFKKRWQDPEMRKMLLEASEKNRQKILERKRARKAP